MKIGNTVDHIPGEGVYVSDSSIHASVFGKQEQYLNANTEETRPTIRVVPLLKRSNIYTPNIGDVIYGKVSKVTSTYARVEILSTETQPLTNSFTGTIIKENMRSYDVDKIDVFKCFTSGDVVKARVLSLGKTAQSLFLSTAENEMGVVFSRNEYTDALMIPINWYQFQCPLSFIKESRKVAKPDIGS